MLSTFFSNSFFGINFNVLYYLTAYLFLGARLWLMFGFVASFASIIAGIWIMFSDFVFVKGNAPVWPGVALFLQTFFIFTSSLVYKFGRTEELWD